MQYSQLIFLAAIAVAFYFLLIRPQQQQAKRQREMIAGLAPGDSIVTIGGIFATVIAVADDRLRVAVADGSELEIAPRAVSDIVEVDAEDDAEDTEPAEESPEVADVEDSSK
jgi:preprotein translocase subunit YajC